VQRGYSVMLGYWNNPEATSQAITPRDGCTRADLATVDDDGT